MLTSIQHRVDSGLLVITLANSADGNRLDPAMLGIMESALVAAQSDPQIRAIALVADGAPGTAFCHGMNLDSLAASLQEGSANPRLAAVEAYGRVLELLAFASKPSIALVGGTVKAGGVGLVAACDFVIANAQASFELTEVFFGLIPANVLPYLAAWRLSPARAKFYTLSALPLDCQKAYSEGLVDIVAETSLDSALKTLCKQLWRAEPGAMQSAKQFFRSLGDLPASQSRDFARQALLTRMDSPAVSQAMESLRAGESPAWFQRFKPSAPIAPQ